MHHAKINSLSAIEIDTNLSLLFLLLSLPSYILIHCCSAADGKTTAADASCKDPQPACG